MRRRDRALFALVALAGALAAGEARANHGGIPGYSGNPATNAGLTCNGCHSGGAAPLVVLSGPTVVNGGEKNSYTLSISGGQEGGCGLGVSAAAGELLVAQAGTQLWNGEITHTAPRAANASGNCVYRFDWTAPIAGGTVRLYGAGNSVNLNETTAGDRAASDVLAVTVNGAPPGQIPPIADADGPHSGVIGTPIAFDGTGSTDPDGQVVSYLWRFGDGSRASGSSPNHIYTTPGDYTVTLTVTDDDGYTDTDRTTARVVRRPGALGAKRVAAGIELVDAAFVTAPDFDPRLFIVQQRCVSCPTDKQHSRIWILKNGAILPQPFLLLPDVWVGPPGGSEKGLRGLAFPPDFVWSGLFYVLHTDATGATVLARYRVRAGNPDLADASSREELIVVPHEGETAINHMGSHVEFGPDGLLWLAIGDFFGGAVGGDPLTHPSQRDDTLKGKLLRIDVSGGLGSGYSIPPGNPFVGRGNPPDEIFAKGFRNPYRFSIDPVTRKVFVADVGGTQIESMHEIDPRFGGVNAGWPIKEGSTCRFAGHPQCTDGSIAPPIHEYAHTTERCAIIGGSVYRGFERSLAGRMFFADWCSGEVWSLVPDGAGGVGNLIEHTGELVPDTGTIGSISAIGRDGWGELYILDNSGGELFKLTARSLPCSDGLDNDGDGRADYPLDPGCFTPRSVENPTCQDGRDNDGDRRIDFDGGASLNGGVAIAPPDPHCTAPWREERPRACGLGWELALLGLPLARLRPWRRRPRPEPG